MRNILVFFLLFSFTVVNAQEFVSTSVKDYYYDNGEWKLFYSEKDTNRFELTEYFLFWDNEQKYYKVGEIFFGQESDTIFLHGNENRPILLIRKENELELRFNDNSGRDRIVHFMF